MTGVVVWMGLVTDAAGVCVLPLAPSPEDAAVGPSAPCFAT